MQADCEKEIFDEKTIKNSKTTLEMVKINFIGIFI